jgi:hypothetical protein
MPAPAPSTAVRPARLPEPVPPPVDDAQCDACPHGVTHHDAIGLRFCRATRNSALDRGCVCRPA